MGSENAAKQELRTIHFPRDRAVGTLIAGRMVLAGTTEWDWSTRWVARGAVQVPKASRLRLEWAGGVHDLSPLLELEPDDLSLLYLTSGDVSWLDDERARPIAHLRGLEELALAQSAITDAAFHHLATLARLQKLYLGNTRITGSGFGALLATESLQVLDLGETDVGDRGLGELQRFPMLLDLDLADIQGRYTKRGLANLLKISSLERISLHGLASIPKEIVAGLAELTSLREAALSRTGLTDASLGALHGPPSLRILDLSYTRVRGPGLQCLQWLPNLRALLLNGTGVTDSALGYLGYTPDLEALEMGDTKVTDAGLAAIRPLEGLRRLVLDDTPVSDSGMHHIGHLHSLEQLAVSHTKVGDAGLHVLRHLSRLTMLSMREAGDISDDGLVSLATLGALEQLFLGPTTVTDGGLRHLYGLRRLRTLFLTAPAVTDAGAAALRAALPDCGIHVN